MSIKFKKAKIRKCPICGGPREKSGADAKGRRSYDCGMVLRRTGEWWKVKRLCDYAFDDDMRPYVRNVLIALYRRKRTIRSIIKFLKDCGWVGYALIPETVELALRVLDQDWGVGLAEGVYEL